MLSDLAGFAVDRLDRTGRESAPAEKVRSSFVAARDAAAA